MKIGIIVGSHRRNSQSAKIAKWFAGQLEQRSVAHYILDMADQPFPLWEESIWDGDPEWAARIQPISNELKQCEGFIVISPEWGGMVTPALKNFFLICSQGELSHKPGLIVSVSAGRGGSYPVNELRTSSYKNTRICYLPEHLIVQQAGAVMNDELGDHADSYIRDRGIFCLDILLAYSQALAPVRETGVTQNADFVNGM